MKTNNLKLMKATGIVVIFVCCFWIGLGSILDVLNATVINGGYMKWNPERITWQRYIISGYLLTSVGFAAIISTLIYKVLSGLKKKVLFTTGNAKLIFLSGFVYMFMVNFRENFDFAVNGAIEKTFPLPDMAVPALVITIFGYLYTMAIDIKEENDLTI